MDFISIFFLSMSLISFYLFFKLKSILKNNENSSSDMEKEAHRVLFENAIDNFNGNYPLEGRMHTKGLSLIKDTNGKYTLIPQIKVCDTGLR